MCGQSAVLTGRADQSRRRPRRRACPRLGETRAGSRKACAAAVARARSANTRRDSGWARPTRNSAVCASHTARAQIARGDLHASHDCGADDRMGAWKAAGPNSRPRRGLGQVRRRCRPGAAVGAAGCVRDRSPCGDSDTRTFGRGRFGVRATVFCEDYRKLQLPSGPYSVPRQPALRSPPRHRTEMETLALAHVSSSGVARERALRSARSFLSGYVSVCAAGRLRSPGHGSRGLDVNYGALVRRLFLEKLGRPLRFTLSIQEFYPSRMRRAPR